MPTNANLPTERLVVPIHLVIKPNFIYVNQLSLISTSEHNCWSVFVLHHFLIFKLTQTREGGHKDYLSKWSGKRGEFPVIGSCLKEVSIKA